jgi:single-strand DNA-binding protein
MASFNRVLLMGNLTRDIEVRQTTGSQVVANFGLAMNRRYKTAAGEEREEVTFVDCEAWGPQAEIMAKYLSKGRPLFVEGRLKLDQWQDKEGNKQSKLRVVVENFQFIGSPAGAGGGPGGAGGPGGGSGGGGEGGAPREQAPRVERSSRGPSSAPVQHEPVSDEDIPF